MNEDRANALFARYVECLVVDGVRVSVEELAQGDAEVAAALRQRVDAFHRIDAVLSQEPESLIGQTLGPYRVLESLGVGGMAAVYRATDTRLHRQVALKVLPSVLALDPGRRGRLEREARLLAALNHPHITSIHGFERADGIPFLVLELVEGETLAARLARGPLPLGELLPLFREIALALEAAHDRGIIHRDLKPANIKITPDGHAKVLDFGLGKATEAAGLRVSAFSMARTKTGTILGTPRYMSPEQARGKKVDHRADLWSFGCVLYESLTGQPAFEGATFSDVVKAVVERDPDWNALAADTPAPLRELLASCLAKNPRRRLARAATARAVLERLEGRPGAGPSSASGGGWSSAPHARLAVVGVLGVLVVAGLLAMSLPHLHRREPPPLRQTQLTLSGKVGLCGLAPDGNFIAHLETTSGSGDDAKVLVRELAAGQAIAVLEGRGFEDLRWSPGGAELLVSGTVEGIPGTFIVPRLGGMPRRFPFRSSVAWSPDGSRFAGVVGRSLVVTDARTGEETILFPAGSAEAPGTPVAIDWSPSGGFIVYSTERDDRISLWTLPATGGEAALVAEAAVIASPRCSPRGDEVYFARREGQSSELWKVAVARETGRPRGVPHLVRGSLDLIHGFSISADGLKLLHTRTTVRRNLRLARLGRPAGGAGTVRLQPITAGPFVDSEPAISPNGTLVAFTRDSADAREVFVTDVQGGTPRQVTFTGGRNFSPVWSPRGDELAYLSVEKAGTTSARIHRVNASGGPPRLFSRARAAPSTRLAWAPQPRILYSPDSFAFRWLEPATEDETPLPGTEATGASTGIWLSPDGKHVALGWTAPGRGSTGTLVSIVSFDTGRATRLSESVPSLLGFGPEGTSVLALTGAAARGTIVRLALAGGRATPWATLPGDEAYQAGAVATNGRSLVLAGERVVSDLFLVEHFDPDVASNEPRSTPTR